MNLTHALIICTKNRLHDIINCLSSVKMQTKSPEEIIIIDSSKNPLNKHESFNALFNEKIFTSSNLIYKHTSPGLTYQRNVGVKACNTDIIHFIDDDTILDKNYLLEMMKIFELHKEYAGGMGYITNVNNKQYNLERAIRTLFLLQKDHSKGKFTLSGMPTHTHGTTKFCNVKVLSGCSSYKREILLKYHFDEHLTGYASMEDCDISKRVSNEHKLFFNPNAHFQHLPSKEDRSSLINAQAMYIRNYRYLFFKNFYPENKLKIISYWWSILGLFILAIYKRNLTTIVGYFKGLWNPLVFAKEHSI